MTFTHSLTKEVQADLDSELPDRFAERAAYRLACQRGLKRPKGISGEYLRNSLPGEAALDFVRFRRWRTRAEIDDVVRIGRRSIPLLEAVARLKGAINAAGQSTDCPQWLFQDLVGSGPIPKHRCGVSRSWEARSCQWYAWHALLSAGSWGRLLRRVVAVQYGVSERWPRVRVSRREAIAALANRGVKGAIRSIIRSRLNAYVERARKKLGL